MPVSAAGATYMIGAMAYMTGGIRKIALNASMECVLPGGMPASSTPLQRSRRAALAGSRSGGHQHYRGRLVLLVLLVLWDPQGPRVSPGRAYTIGQMVRKNAVADYATQWQEVPLLFATFIPETPAGGAIANVISTEVAAFAGNFAGSYGVARVGPVSISVIMVKKSRLGCGR
jgi:hypothetical protein